MNTTNNAWDTCVEIANNAPSQTFIALVDYMGQVLNGGHEQWIDNGYYGRDKELVARGLRNLAELNVPAARQALDCYQDAIAIIRDDRSRDDEPEYWAPSDEAREELDEIDERFYGIATDALAAAFLTLK